MAQYKLVLPKMGESVAEATVTKWLKQPGDLIEADDAVLEIATDKVDSEVPSPVSGKLVKHLFNENEVAQVGDVIALIEIEGENEETPSGVADTKESLKEKQEEDRVIPGIEQIAQREQTAGASVDLKNTSRFYSPLVKSIAAEEGISPQELDNIKGTGAEGRVTKQDILDYVNNQAKKTASASRDLTEQRSSETINNVSKPAASITGGDEIIEMDRMRKIIADHMVMSKQVAPHVTSVVEADVTNIVKWRDKIKTAFEKREGQKITFTPIFIEAVTRALKDFPMVNVSVNGSQIIKKRDINIGIAAALPTGNLIVPVIRNADQLNIVGLTKTVNDLANRARTNKLQPDEVKDGTFTITNIGSFGNIIGTPIINQPQVAILAIGTIKKKPAVIETEAGDVIAIRHMMFLSLSYDHRVVDGALGGTFLRRIADYMEAWDINQEV
ncbi:dihydrolipoamide acetyltransferase family protein [Rubrolithibacter danxiaensis]|uniref:dihydrolipoamide acetyltransferase family protein n=1 Tax=Rubrolithibacter danxiaensis TaxID=3390805 RepID=UPI003BF7723D